MFPGKGRYLERKSLFADEALVPLQTFGSKVFVFEAVHEMEVFVGEVILMSAIVEIVGQQSGPEEEMMERRVILQGPAADRGATLGKTHQHDAQVGPELGPEVIEEVLQISHVIGNFVEPLLSGHPGGADLALYAVPVEARQAFRSDDQVARGVQDLKLVDEIGGQLAVAVASQPKDFGLRTSFAEREIAGSADDGQRVSPDAHWPSFFRPKMSLLLSSRMGSGRGASSTTVSNILGTCRQ